MVIHGVSMNAPYSEDESINRIDYDDDFEVVKFFDFSSNPFYVREASLGLHHSSAIDDGTGS